MLITGTDLGWTISDHVIFDDVFIVCQPATLTALVGPSGSGKTTLLHCLGMLQQPSRGSITLDGVDATHWTERKRRAFWQSSAAFVLQDYGIIEDETVEFNVFMRTPRRFARRKSVNHRANEILNDVGLSGRGAELAAHLSGGEKQRLAIARAVYKNASAIFVDEPTASLDVANRQRVIDLLLDRAHSGATVIVATHDEEMISACSVIHPVGQAQSAKEAHVPSN